MKMFADDKLLAHNF